MTVVAPSPHTTSLDLTRDIQHVVGTELFRIMTQLAIAEAHCLCAAGARGSLNGGIS